MQEPVYDGNGYLISEQTTSHFFIDGTPVTFNKLPKIISTIKKAMNGSEFWTKTASDSNLDSARKTIYDHIFELRSGEISATEKLKSSTVSTLKIRKTDMNDVTHSLTLGNDAHCCTRAGSGSNQFAAPRYIMDKFISAIEIMDGNISVGNSMCFFAEVNGQLAFVIDNIEVTAGYQYDDTLRDAFMQYAKQMCDEMGLTDIPIYAGPNRHKFKMKYETISEPEVKIIGSTGGEITYIDSVTKRMAIDEETVIVPDLMFRIR